MSNDIQNRLEDYLVRAYPKKHGIKVSGFSSLSNGWESDVYAFDLSDGSVGVRQQKELVLRIYPGNDAHEKSAREFEGMRRLYTAGYPVPQVYLLERDASPFERPFVIMERIAGQLMWSLMFGPDEEKNQALMSQFCRLAVQLHELDWRPFVNDSVPVDGGNPYALVKRELGRWREFMGQNPLPGFIPVMEWLEARVEEAPSARPAPVHWDFHPMNVLLRNDGSAVVIDWTGIDVSDARFDLAWTMLLVGVYQGSQWREPLLREYERQAGVKIEALEFFDAAVCLKRLYSVAISMSAGAEQMGMRPGAETIIREQLYAQRNVYELLLERTSIHVPEIEQLLSSYGE